MFLLFIYCFIVVHIMRGGCVWSLLCVVVLGIFSSLAIIFLR